jgi:restriction endonuclease S subunit
MRIGEISTVQAGYQFRDKVEPTPNGNVSLLQIKDIPDRRRITPESIDRISLGKSYESYRVAPGDVVFLSRGHKQFAAVVPGVPRETIASGYFYILRPDPNVVRPAYLAWYLNQRPMQDQLKQLSKGTHMPFVSLAEFRELDIPIPPITTQDLIAELDELAVEEQSLLRQLAEKRSFLVQHISLTAAGRIWPDR